MFVVANAACRMPHCMFAGGEWTSITASHAPDGMRLMMRMLIASFFL